MSPSSCHLNNKYTNIEVVLFEKDITELISKSNCVVLIVSTAMYEALQFGKKVAVYKKINWQRQLLTNAFSQLSFIENTEDLIEVIYLENTINPSHFFEQFDEELFEKIFQ